MNTENNNTPSVLELLKSRQTSTDNLINECGIFFAFNDKQFTEGKATLKEGDTLLNMGMGGFIPKSSVDKYIQGMKDIENTFIENIEKYNLRKSYILYELRNHEAFYTGNIESTLDSLMGEYTEEEVKKVYSENYTKEDL